MGFTHSWNGTILTITSDSGTSSADLQGPVGDTGPRGPQGVGGGTTSIDLSDYYTKEEIDDKLLALDEPTEDGNISLDGYATEEYVSAQIAAAQLEGSEVDLSAYYTKSQVDALIPLKVSQLVNDSNYTTNEEVQELIASSSSGSATVDLSNYYTKTQVDALFDEFEVPATNPEDEVNLDGYYTKEEVDAKIAEAQLEGAGVDMSAYYTKTEIAALGHLTEAEVLALIQANIPSYVDGNEVSY